MSSSSSEAIDFARPPIALSPEEWQTVALVLRHHLRGREVWAYGSRARGTKVKRFSDLDLAIEGTALSLDERSSITDAFEESALPFKVDLTEVATLEPEFRRRIEVDKVVIARPE